MPTHYLGTIVTADPATITPPTSKVIDGQQRLVTATVALMAARDARIKILGKAEKNEFARQELMDEYDLAFHNPGATGEKADRLVPQAIDRAAYKALLDRARVIGRVKTDAVGLAEEDSTRILDAYNWFSRELSRRTLNSPPFEMISFADLYPLDPEIVADTIMNRLYAIKIITDSTDDANMIFESLNTKGRDLQQVDLIKNYLYLSLDDEASDVYAAYWRPMEKLLRQDELERYAWASLVSAGDNTLQKRTYEAVQRRLRDGDVDEVKRYVSELRSEAGYFERMIRPATEPLQEVRTALERLNAAGGATAAPLVLYCYREYRADRAPVADLVAALNAVESFLVRRMLAGEPTNNLNSMFGTMCARLHNDARFKSTDNLADDVRRVLMSRPDDWPGDDRVRDGILYTDLYSAQKVEQRIHVLRSLDEFYNTSNVDVHYETSQKTLEHIAPQDEEAPDWVSDLGKNDWSEARLFLNSLANLTLLTGSDNSSLGNAGWTKKRTVYAASAYALTSRIADRFDADGGWSAERIEERSNDLGDAVLLLWPRSVVSPHAVKSASGVASAGLAAESEEDFDDADLFASDGQVKSLLDEELDGGPE